MTAEVRAGDWRDVLPGTYDPTHAVVITDPPYGLQGVDNASRGPGSHGDRPAMYDKGYPDDTPWRQHVADVLALLPAVRHVIRGPATAVIRHDYPQPRRLCIEASMYRRRDAHRPGVVPYLWQGWCVYGRLRIGRRARVPVGDAQQVRPFVDDGMRRGRGHGGITPYASALWMVETWADPDMVVIDPYAGTGTIGRAALALGFDYLAAEVVPRWHAEAVASIESYQPALGL